MEYSEVGISIPDAIAVELEKLWAQFSNQYGRLQAKAVSKSKAELELLDEQQRVEAKGYFDTGNLEDAGQRVMTSIVQRRGQSEFRRRLLSAYPRYCEEWR